MVLLRSMLVTSSLDRGPWKSSGDSAVKDFRELNVWQKAHQLTLAVYQITAAFPREE